MRSTQRRSGPDGTRLVERRTMLGQVGGGALLAATAGLLPHGPTVTPAVGAALAEDNLTWMPAWQIRDLVAARDVSAAEVLEHFLNRIEEHDGTLNAFKPLDTAGARDQAKRADDGTHPEGQLRAPSSTACVWPGSDDKILRAANAFLQAFPRSERLRIS